MNNVFVINITASVIGSFIFYVLCVVTKLIYNKIRRIIKH